ncbi:AraC family transcriptional regulator [Maribacter sp. ACAM166]|uniref:AraC family transcriptional regulator n=1 Tax=Maribacter sp. ACAM166 TaxID=2508996 RepID=UPI0010FF41F0|nr:AraC family transcriptional regulator [Maribacter sp. ACAM166]TLP71116.1 helix-turn-helix transcriptional regulator [Maribacter sp. ACAM166]
MELHMLNRSSNLNESLTVSHNQHSNFLRVWHFHPEFELVIILKSSGTRFIGDSIQKFEEGEVVLIGDNLPHMWLNDKQYFKENSVLKAEAISIHFNRDFLGTDFFEIPEMQSISNLLDRAKLGIRFYDPKTGLLDKIKSLVDLSPTARIYKTIEILDALTKHQRYKLLSSNSFLRSFNKTENKRLAKIYEYVFENFNTDISSSDVAEIAGMNKSAFSRFFKETNRKTFTTYLNEIRIGYASKLLLENKESITEIGYLSGFNNISNFNRQFKKIHDRSPSSYSKFHKQKR